jgi:hypothetical protein
MLRHSVRTRCFIALATAALLAIVLTGPAAPHPARAADVYGDFNTFAAANFGIGSEPEMTRHFGEELRLVTEGDWVHASEQSAVVAWETSLPAVGRIEFGLTEAYGSTTAPDERPFFHHVGYLTGLKPDAVYHYRLTAIDERGQTVTSDDRTLLTPVVSGAVHVPAGVTPGPPYLLDKADTTYVLTQDITANGTAFHIGASGITLDLNGHTVVYNQRAGAPDPVPPGDYGYLATQGPCGIRTRDGTRVRILNGTVRQGAGNGASNPSGYYPIALRRPLNTEVAGVTVDYYGTEVTGLFINTTLAGTNIHHNIFLDRGTGVLDRHEGVDAVGPVGAPDGGSAAAHHNLVKRTRQRGINAGNYAEVHDNEVYVDSWASNSYGIMYYSSNSGLPIHHVTVANNQVFGTGYHPIGIGSGDQAHDVTVTGNYVQVQGQAPTSSRWTGGAGIGEPVDTLHPVNGFRYQEGAQTNILVADNVVVAKARGVATETAYMRGLWIGPTYGTDAVVFRGNRVKVEAQNEYADGYAVAALGSQPDDETLDIRYEANTFLANTTNIQFGDSYGFGGRHEFVDTTLARLGADPRYRTIRMGWQGLPKSTYGHTFLDTRFEDGASYDSVSFDGAPSGRYDFTAEWRLTLTVSDLALVRIVDLLGQTVFDSALPGGTNSLALKQFRRSPSGKLFMTPHRITVTYPSGVVLEERVTMDRPVALSMLAPPTPTPTATATATATPTPTATPDPGAGRRYLWLPWLGRP